MRLRSDLTINGKLYPKGSDIAWYSIYPFFLIHMLAFGSSGFLMAYGSKEVPVGFLYLHGGFAVLIYTVFYVSIFGVDEVKWMFINAILGILGIYTQIDWLLSLFGKKIGDYPFYVHVIPFLYFVLYTFLIRHAIMDITNSHDDPARKKFVEGCYVVISVVFYAGTWFFENR